VNFITKSIWRLFGYAIAEESLGRRPSSTVLPSPDRELNIRDRQKAISRMRELSHDFSLVKWALKKHVDFVAKYLFQSRTGNEALDNQIEKIISTWSERGNCEVTNRHTLSRLLRIIEICRTIDGDVGILKLADGRIQVIEGDRIRNRNQYNENQKNWKHGVLTDDYNAAVSYAIHRRRTNGDFIFERFVSAEHLILHGYFERYDQVRGIGLLTTAANTFRDVYESFDYALAKAKAMQLFGLKFKRSSEEEALGSAEDQKKRFEERKLALKGKASYMIELMPDEDMSVIESGTPSTQFQDYTKLMIMVALKSLDICYSMFDEAHTNFYGSRAGITQYVESCKSKREDNQNLLKELTRWKLANEIIAGRLTLPDGMTVNDLVFEWTPAGLPWWRPDEEARGLMTTIQNGFDSYSGVNRSLGREFRDIMRERHADEEFARSLGITLPTMIPQKSLNINT
jgi:capsid protein